MGMIRFRRYPGLYIHSRTVNSVQLLRQYDILVQDFLIVLFKYYLEDYLVLIDCSYLSRQEGYSRLFILFVGLPRLSHLSPSS